MDEKTLLDEGKIQFAASQLQEMEDLLKIVECTSDAKYKHSNEALLLASLERFKSKARSLLDWHWHFELVTTTSSEWAPASLLAYMIREQLKVLARIDHGLEFDLGLAKSRRGLIGAFLYRQMAVREDIEIVRNTLRMGCDMAVTLQVILCALDTLISDPQQHKAIDTVISACEEMVKKRYRSSYAVSACWNFGQLSLLLSNKVAT